MRRDSCDLPDQVIVHRLRFAPQVLIGGLRHVVANTLNTADPATKKLLNEVGQRHYSDDDKRKPANEF